MYMFVRVGCDLDAFVQSNNKMLKYSERLDTVICVDCIVTEEYTFINIIIINK